MREGRNSPYIGKGIGNPNLAVICFISPSPETPIEILVVKFFSHSPRISSPLFISQLLGWESNFSTSIPASPKRSLKIAKINLKILEILKKKSR